MKSSITSYLKRSLATAMIAGSAYGCSVDRNPTGPNVTEGLAEITSTCQPRVVWEVPGHPNVQPVFGNITKDDCGGLSPEEVPSEQIGKYQCPALFDGAHAVVGNIYQYQLTGVTLAAGATASDSAVARTIMGPGDAHHGQIINVQTYPKYVLFDGQAPTTPIPEYNVETGTGWGNRLVVQEGTYIRNIEDIDPGAPVNIRDSNAIQVLIGDFQPNARGLHGVMQSGTLVARVALPAAGGGYTHEVRSSPAHTYFVSQTGTKAIHNQYRLLGSIDDQVH